MLINIELQIADAFPHLQIFWSNSIAYREGTSKREGAQSANW